MPEEFKLDKVLKSISERQDPEEWEKFQAEERAKLGPVDAQTLFGQRAVEIAFNRLKVLGFGASQSQVDFEMQRMADGYALQGDYARAEALSTREDKKNEYRAILRAIETTEQCACPKKSNGNPTEFIKDYIPQPLYCCSLCNHLRC